jgi:hypothetical protein
VAVSEKAEVTNARKTSGKDMLQETAQKLFAVNESSVHDPVTSRRLGRRSECADAVGVRCPQKSRERDQA